MTSSNIWSTTLGKKLGGNRNSIDPVSKQGIWDTRGKTFDLLIVVNDKIRELTDKLDAPICNKSEAKKRSRIPVGIKKKEFERIQVRN
jgi:hypothetical protein